MSNAYHVELESVSLSFGERPLFAGLSCGFPRGQISSLLGRSGSGKSTLLRLVGGLLRPDSGTIRIAGEDITQLADADLGRARRRIGMMFQAGALLDAFTVAENLALPLHEHTDLPEDQIAARVAARLADVGLDDAGPLRPAELSGGMVKRAALARAIVLEPEIVLADEPFSDLDPVNARRIEELLLSLNRRRGMTVVCATHHLESALRMSSWFVYVSDGRALQGPPPEMRSSGDPRLVPFFAGTHSAADPTPAADATPGAPGGWTARP